MDESENVRQFGYVVAGRDLTKEQTRTVLAQTDCYWYRLCDLLFKLEHIDDNLLSLLKILGLPTIPIGKMGDEDFENASIYVTRWAELNKIKSPNSPFANDVMSPNGLSEGWCWLPGVVMGIGACRPESFGYFHIGPAWEEIVAVLPFLSLRCIVYNPLTIKPLHMVEIENGKVSSFRKSSWPRKSILTKELVTNGLKGSIYDAKNDIVPIDEVFEIAQSREWLMPEF
jgi:hypothetical protein